MMSELNRTLSLIQKDLDLPDSDLKQLPDFDFHRLKKYLEGMISELMDNDFNRLINAMYRIDISEHQLSEALHSPDPSQVASKIAELIIQREIEKVQTRKKYSGN